MTIPISMIPYANMAPYRELGAPPGWEWVPLTPRQSTIALREGRVWAAAIPVGDLPSLSGLVRFLGPAGIAARGAVDSVLFFSARPLPELTPDTPIFITNQTSTSVRLLFLLLGYELGFDRLPRVTTSMEEAQAALVIGDQALVMGQRPPFPHVTDLAEAWRRRHGLPFVFARWVCRVDAPTSLRETFQGWLEQLEQREEELIQRSAPAEARRLGLSVEVMVDYLRRIVRVFGPEELRAQDFFLAELSRHDHNPLLDDSRMSSRDEQQSRSVEPDGITATPR